MIIGLVGRARSGKDTVARLIPSFEIRRIAQPVKDSLKCLYGWDDRHTEGPYKEHIDPHVGKSPRQAMIETAEKVKRESGQDFFIQMLLDNWNGKNIVIPDVRFQNEIDAIRRYGGLLVKVNRELSAKFQWEDHIDELVTDYTLHNTSLPSLRSQVEDLLESVNREFERVEQSSRRGS
jgi:hypothetical protein